MLRAPAQQPVLPAPWNVVIPCHNYGRYLRESVESVLASDADYEIHIVNDASGDETAEVAVDFVREYPHVHYLRSEERRGPAYSRNRGIAAMEGEFVVLLDADDRIGPEYLFRARQRFAAGVDVVNPDAMLFGASQDALGGPEDHHSPDVATEELGPLLFGIPPGTVVADGGIDERFRVGRL